MIYMEIQCLMVGKKKFWMADTPIDDFGFPSLCSELEDAEQA